MFFPRNFRPFFSASYSENYSWPNYQIPIIITLWAKGTGKTVASSLLEQWDDTITQTSGYFYFRLFSEQTMEKRQKHRSFHLKWYLVKLTDNTMFRPTHSSAFLTDIIRISIFQFFKYFPRKKATRNDYDWTNSINPFSRKKVLSIYLSILYTSWKLQWISETKGY